MKSYFVFMRKWDWQSRKARFQNFLYRMFKIRPKYPCGRNKNDKHLCCRAPLPATAREINSVIIFKNERVVAEFFCPCCRSCIGSTAMSEEKYHNEWNGDEEYLFNDWRDF